MRSLPALLVSAFILTPLLAQNGTAVLAGRVTDPAGLGVAHAQVQATQRSTGAVRTTLSTLEGFYRFDLLPPGDYSIRITVSGFKTVQDDNVHLQVAQSSEFNTTLVLGSTTESVQVEATVSPLLEDNTTIEYEVTSQPDEEKTLSNTAHYTW